MHFGVGIILPIFKDRLGDISSANNYYSQLCRKFLNIVLYIIMNVYFIQISFSLVFKKSSSCSHAVFDC